MPIVPRFRVLAVALAVLLAAGLLSGCGGGGGDDSLRQDVETRLMENDGLDQEEASCVAGILVDDVDEDVLREQLDSTGSEVPEQALNAMDRALGECFDLGVEETTTTTG